MKRFRTFGFALWLALAVLVGQQAAALHDLGHATSEISQDEGTPSGSSPCEEHFLYAQFSGVVGASASIPAVSADEIAATWVIQAFAPAPIRLAFHSRAPPDIL